MESHDPKRRAIFDSFWLHFPADVLVKVAFKHVTSAATYAALRGVCRSWRAALPATVPAPHRLPPQLPVLLLGRRQQDLAASAFSLATERTFALRHLADAPRSFCVGSCYGWLFLFDPSTFNLILRNPFTGDTIRLPPSPRSDDQYLLVYRAILSSDPSADRDFLVVLFTNPTAFRCFTCQNGDNFWTVREYPPFLLEDIMFYEDRRCIAIGFGSGECMIFDFAIADGGDGFFTKVPNLPVSGSPFLVESAGNVWLVMVRTTASGEDQVDIYRLDLSGLPDKVTAVSERGDLGGRILFLERGNSMSVASTHFPRFEGDSIYFTKMKTPILTSLRDNSTVTIRKCQIKNGVAHRCSVEFECGVHSLWPKFWWLPPNIHEKLGE